MAYNIVKKNQPNLIDYQLTKKLARINNINIKTGGLLNEPKVEPNQLTLLLSDIKQCIFQTLRNNWLLIISLLVISYYLYIRYHTVKELKLQKAKEQEHNDLKFKQYQLELKQKEEFEQNAILKLNSLRTQFEEFDDANIKNQLYDSNKDKDKNKNKSIMAINEMNHGYAVF
jgi:hypothetical protein